MAQIIGYVKSVEGGSFFVKDAKGHIRQLKEGEAIHNGELVYGASNNIQSAQIIVDVTLKGAGDIVIGGNGALAFDTSLLEGVFTHHDAVVYVNSVHDAVAAIASKEAPATSTDNGETTAGETAAGDTVTNTEIPTDTFAARTGAVADVSTGLSSVVNGEVSATFNETNTPDVNDQPVVANVTGIVNEALDGLNIISGQLIASDADIPDTHTFFAVDSSLLVNGIPATGVTFTLNPDGTYQVSGDFNRLAVGENATVSFQYYAVDNGLPIGAPHTSLPATVTITVMGTNDQPVVSDINVNTNGKEQLVKDVLPGDTYQTIVFESHDATDVVSVDDTKEDIVTTFNGNLATAVDDDVSDIHTYALVADSARVDSADVDPMDIAGLGVVVNPNGDYTVTGDFNALAAGEMATVTFQYVANDGRGFDGTDGINEKSLSEPKTVTLTITGSNDQPVVSDVVVAEPIVEVLEGNTFFKGSLATATDNDVSDTHKYYGVTDGEMVIVKVVDAPENVTINAWVRSVTVEGIYQVEGDFNALAEGETATISFQYYAVDSSVTQLNGESNTSELKTVTLTVTGTNDQPIVSDVTTTATETNGTQTFSGQLALTTDLDTTDTHTFQQTGTASVMASNEVVSVTDFSVVVATNGTYTVNGNFDHLAAGETAKVTFQYTATDDSGTGNAVSEEKTVTLTVTGTNDQPIISDVTTTAIETNGTQTISGQLALATDLDTTDTHIFQQFGIAAVVTNGGSTAVVTDLAVAVAANGAYTVAGNFDALAEGETATVTFQYVANDQNGFDGTDGINESSISEPKTVTITVTGTNDAPVANPDTLSATEDTTVTYTAAQLLGNDTDVDTAHTSLTIASVTSGNNGTVVLNVDGTVTFTPTKNYSGQADFTYTTTDGALTSNSALVTVNVIPVADAPTLTLDPIKPFTVTENFQELSVGAYSQAVVPTALTGTVWYTDNASGQIEIGQEKTYLANSSVNNVIELERDVGEVSNLYTEIPASLGDTYTLSFDYSPRVTSNGLNSSVVNVVLDGVTVKTLDTRTPGFINYTLILPILTDSVSGKHKLEFIAADKNSIGGLLDNITLSEMMNTGMAGSPIHLSSISSSAIHYALTDMDGSETLALTIGGLPAGFILSDGTNVFEASAGFSTATVTGWNLDSLTVTPLSTATGTMVDLTITATSTESANGDQASTSLPLHLTVLPSSADNTIVFDTMYTSIDGGAGTDTLVLGLDTNIDFSALGNVIHNIEIIDLGQNGAHTLEHLTVQDVMDMTDPTTHDLIILGGADDTVNLDSTGGVWTKTGTTDTSTIVGHTLDIYTNSADATVTLKIEDTTHTIV